MEVGSPDLSMVPSWVVVDRGFYRKDPASFLADDGETYASARASNGEEICVSFILSALPGTSRLCLHCPKERKLCGFDKVVAAHHEAVLFSLKVDYKGLLSPGHAIDYFIYWAGSSGPELTRLPRWYMTEQEVLAAEGGGSWSRDQQISLGIRGTGLLLTGGGEFVVAELHLDVDKLEDKYMDAPLDGKLFRLCSEREALVTGGFGKWEVKDTRARGGRGKFGDLHGWWEAHVVLPYHSYLCWVDYFRGIIFCDVNHPEPELQYLPFPLEFVPFGDPDPFCMAVPQEHRAVGITKDGMMKFVKIVCDDGVQFGCSEPGSAFTITIYTLIHLGYDEMDWSECVTIKAPELWAMEGYGIQLPRIVPRFPLVSMDDPSIIHFVLTPDDGTKTWVVALDTDSRKVLWYREIRAVPSDEDLEMSSYNIFCNMPFFPCEFSKYLQKAAPSPFQKVFCGKKTVAGKKATWQAPFEVDCLMGHDNITS